MLSCNPSSCSAGRAPLRELRSPQRLGGGCQDGQIERSAVLDAGSENELELGDHRFHSTELMLEAGQIEIKDLLSSFVWSWTSEGLCPPETEGREGNESSNPLLNSPLPHRTQGTCRISSLL